MADARSASSENVPWLLTMVTETPYNTSSPPPLMDIQVTSLDDKKLTPLPLRPSDVTSEDHLQRFSSTVRKDAPMGNQTVFSVMLPANLAPAAIELRISSGSKTAKNSGRVQLDYVELQRKSNGPTKFRFTANTCIREKHKWRLFVRDDAWTDRDLRSNAVIAKLEERELRKLRGEGKTSEPREPGDRIYDFASYNDLGRPVLGGDGEFKYPRRLATNRAPDLTCPLLETPPTKSGILEPLVGTALVGTGLGKLIGGRLASPWVPDDDNFSSAKSAGFVGTAVVSALPSVLEQIGLGGVGEEFDSLAEVVTLYDEDLINAIVSSKPPARNYGKEMKENVSRRDANINLGTGRRRPFWLGSLFRPLVKLVPHRLVKLLRPILDGVRGVAENADKTYVSLRDFQPPRSIADTSHKTRFNTWATDEEFGRMMLAGTNPLVIQAVCDEEALSKLLPPGESAIVADDMRSILSPLLEGRSLKEWAQEARTGKCRLFVVDYWLIYDFLDAINEANEPEANAAGESKKGKPPHNRVPHAGRAVLFRRADGRLVPVAIELAHTRGENASIVYTASDPSTVWLAAKLIFLSIDAGYHQLVSHFVRTHACTEPYLIALRRQLSPTHPIFRLLMPHFRYTLPINAGARSLLINKGGVIEEAFTPGAYSMRLSAKVYEKSWRFESEGLVADLARRGFPTTEDELADKVGEYPYAEDGLLIWNALQEYFTEYVHHYYESDDEVIVDGRLQAWWEDVRTNGHPDIKEGWIELQGRDALVDICTTIGWVASAHHAAVNFGQYDYSGWPVSHSPLCRRQAPARGDESWQRLAELDGFYAKYQEAAEKELLTYVAPPDVAMRVMTTIKLLSTHAADEEYLTTEGERMEWLPLQQDSVLNAIFSRFQAKMVDIDGDIDTRNSDPARLARLRKAGGMPYTLLRPTSGEAGVTGKGVPYSISI